MKKTTIALLIALPLLATQLAPGAATTAPRAVRSATAVTAEAPLPDYGVYTLTNAASGKLLDMSGDQLHNEKYDDQRRVVQSPASLDANGQLNQWHKWHVVYRATYDGTRYYQLRNAFSGKLLDVPAGSRTPGTQLQQYHALPLPTDPQLWRIEQTGTAGQYRLVNRASGLAVSNASAPTANAGAITQEVVATGVATQQWTFAALAPSAYRDDEVVRFFNRNDPTQGSAAFDEGMSIPLYWGSNAGKVLWVTQDAADGVVLQGNGSSGKFNCGININYSNSLLLQPSITNWASNAPNVTIPGGANGQARQVCERLPMNVTGDKADYNFAWPTSGVEIGNHVYLQCGEGRFDGVPVAGTQSLYDFTESATGTQWTAVRTIPRGLGLGAAVGYHDGMTRAADGFVYVFGSVATAYGYGSDVYVARFPATDPQAWTYWNGTSWGTTSVATAAARIAQAKGSNNVSYVNGRYVLMTLSQGFNCNDSPRSIYLATATSPTGPFTPFTKVYDIEEHFTDATGNSTPARYYTPGIHPEFVNGRDELLLTYCLNYSACNVDNCVNGTADPYFYRVKGIRVPYSQAGIPPSTPSNVATVYKDCNYSGTAVSLPAGDYNLAALRARGVLDNDLSSLRVSSGYRVVLYADDNFAGASLTVPADNACLVFNALGSSNWNDQVTSLRVQSTGASASRLLATATATDPKPAVSVYPNPVIDRLNLDVDAKARGGQLQITDVTGREVWHGTYSGESVDVSTLKSGLYNLVLRTTDQRKVVFQFIKQ